MLPSEAYTEGYKTDCDVSGASSRVIVRERGLADMILGKLLSELRQS